jgi:hypothetical protein
MSLSQDTSRFAVSSQNEKKRKCLRLSRVIIFALPLHYLYLICGSVARWCLLLFGGGCLQLFRVPCSELLLMPED